MAVEGRPSPESLLRVAAALTVVLVAAMMVERGWVDSKSSSMKNLKVARRAATAAVTTAASATKFSIAPAPALLRI